MKVSDQPCLQCSSPRSHRHSRIHRQLPQSSWGMCTPGALLATNPFLEALVRQGISQGENLINLDWVKVNKEGTVGATPAVKHQIPEDFYQKGYFHGSQGQGTALLTTQPGSSQSSKIKFPFLYLSLVFFSIPTLFPQNPLHSPSQSSQLVVALGDRGIELTARTVSIQLQD